MSQKLLVDENGIYKLEEFITFRLLKYVSEVLVEIYGFISGIIKYFPNVQSICLCIYNTNDKFIG